jgi:hypothetical protein
MKKSHVVAAVPAAILAAVVLAGCAETDVVAKVAVSSFDAAVQKLGNNVAYNAGDKSWQITSPAGDKFLVALDFARPNPDGGSPDFGIDLDAAPFLAAGLDASKLPAGSGLAYRLGDGRFTLRFDWGQDSLKAAADGSATPTETTTPAVGIIATFKQIIASHRDRIGYHEKLDHYGIALGDGNMVEWAKDLGTNDKDLVFVLNPEPLVLAGLDPTKVEGWVYAKVEIKDANGKFVAVDKLLRPFDL